MKTRTPLVAWYALLALSLTTLYALVDRHVLILLAQPLKANLYLSDTQIGSLQGLGAALFSAIAVIPLGWLADRIDRRLLLALCILVWSAAVATCGLATGYWSLLFSVAFLAAGEAGLSPIVYAMIPDLFPERRRMTANFIYYSALILGGGAAIAIAGTVIDHIGMVARWLPNGTFTRETWRLVFFVVAIPGPIFAIAIGLIRLRRKVPQARAEAAALTPQAGPDIQSYLASHGTTIFRTFAGFGLALLGQIAILTWLPVILMREFALSAGAVGAALGGTIIGGSITGLVIVAVCTNYLKARLGALTPVRLPQLGYLIIALLTPLYLLARSATEILVIAGIQIATFTGCNSLTPTVIQDLAPPNLRGRVFAISTVIITLFQVISPITVGLLSDRIFTWPGGLLLSSVTVCAPALLLAALSLRFAETAITRTTGQVRTLVEAP